MPYARPKVILSTNFDLSHGEVRAVRKSRRRTSCDAADLTQLGRRCANTALQVGAQSWSIYPVYQTCHLHPKVFVEFHNWPAMGMCNFQKPIGKERYWWEVLPVAQYIAPSDERAVRDDAGLDRGQAFNPEA